MYLFYGSVCLSESMLQVKCLVFMDGEFRDLCFNDPFKVFSAVVEKKKVVN